MTRKKTSKKAPKKSVVDDLQERAAKRRKEPKAALEWTPGGSVDVPKEIQDLLTPKVVEHRRLLALTEAARVSLAASAQTMGELLGAPKGSRCDLRLELDQGRVVGVPQIVWEDLKK